MFENLKIFSMASALAQHGAARQSIVAENIANADTPGYRARDVASFAVAYDVGSANGPAHLQATRPGHHFAGEAESYTAAPREVYRPGAESPNGNNVSIENEIFAAAEDVTNTEININELVIDYIRENSPVAADVDGRVNVVE